MTMKINDNNLDKLFSQKLSNAESDVPDYCWNAIEQALPKGQSRPIIPLWGRVVVAAVGLLLVGTIGYLTFISQESQQIASVYSDEGNTSLATTPKSKTSALKVKQMDKASPYYTISKRPIPTTNKKAFSKADSGEENKEAQSTSNVALESMENQEGTERPQSEIAEYQVATQNEIEAFANAGKEIETEKKAPTKPRRQSSVGLLAAITGPEGSQNKDEFTSLRTTANMDQLMSIISENQSSPTDNGTSVIHDLPISLGISLEKEISNKFAIQTGICGTYLRSTQKLNTSLYFTDEIQELYYLGLPLSIAYKFAKTERYSFYLKAGGMIEKNIGGRWRDRVKKDGEVIYTKVQHDLENKLQWSSHLGGGANYNLSDHMKLYIEPALTYYIDNNSNIDNIHKQQRLDFTLQAGIRAVFESH